MEKTSEFLQRLCRFNSEVRQVIGFTAVSSSAIRERLAAAEDAERDLRGASEWREEAERNLRVSGGLAETARNVWQEAVIEERIARANAETQVWAMIALSGEAKRLQSCWNQSVPANPERQTSTRPTLVGRFFSITRVQDDTYRFFTISHG